MSLRDPAGFPTLAKVAACPTLKFEDFCFALGKHIGVVEPHLEARCLCARVMSLPSTSILANLTQTVSGEAPAP